jgi:hypothetical protein
VYDLGTAKHPGDANAQPVTDNALTPDNETDLPNQASAVALQGANAYVGFCGGCDPVNDKLGFASGIATNVGGSAAPKFASSSGWHIAAARGLPDRTVTGIVIDPKNPRTVYVSVGGYARFFAPPGALGDDTSKVGSGSVFRSTDAGETFQNISGDLPNAPAMSIVLRGKQLVVGTTVGGFISSSLSGKRWATLGKNLPPVPIFHIELKPGDPKTLVAATFGRGAYTYRFANPRRDLRSFSLGRRVFGGSRHRPLRISFSAARSGRARVVVTGPKFRRTLFHRRVKAKRTYRLALRPAGLRRGRYRVTLTLTVGRKRTRSTLVARKT